MPSIEPMTRRNHEPGSEGIAKKQHESGFSTDGMIRAAELVESGIEATFGCYAFPEEHCRRIRTNNPLERILREIRRRTRVVGSFPDGQSSLNLAAARLRHIAGTEWSTKRYRSMDVLQRHQMRRTA